MYRTQKTKSRRAKSGTTQHAHIIAIHIPWVRDRWHIILAQFAESRVKQRSSCHLDHQTTQARARGDN